MAGSQRYMIVIDWIKHTPRNDEFINFPRRKGKDRVGIGIDRMLDVSDTKNLTQLVHPP